LQVVVRYSLNEDELKLVEQLHRSLNELHPLPMMAVQKQIPPRLKI
jgi:hypothetical protein